MNGLHLLLGGLLVLCVYFGASLVIVTRQRDAARERAHLLKDAIGRFCDSGLSPMYSSRAGDL